MDSPPWLDTVGLYGLLLSKTPCTQADCQRAAQRYAELVEAGRGVDLWHGALRQQIYLGDEAFVARMQSLADPRRVAANQVPKRQRSAPHSLKHWLAICETREEALSRAFREGGLSMTAMAQELGLSVSRVSRLITRAERRRP
jgi:AraC-like DNA-binding protein